MALRERIKESDTDRRLVALLLVIFLVLLGSGAGTIILTGPDSPGTGNETTPTATPTPESTATPTPDDGGGPPSGTETATPTEQSPAATPTSTQTPTSGGGSGGGSGGSGGGNGGGGATSPSPGLELGDDGPLLSVQNLVPGESGTGTLTVRNAEDEDANLTINAIDFTDDENGVTDPEADVDTSPGGELSEHLEVRLFVRDSAGNEEYLLGTEGGYATLTNVSTRTPSSEYGLAAGEEVTLVSEWQLPTSTGNVVQSDRLTTAVTLTLESTDS